MSLLVELSGESLELARAEAGAATEALGGQVVGPLDGAETLFEVRLESGLGRPLTDRLALAHRCLVLADLSADGVPAPTSSPGAAAFRPFRRLSGGAREETVLRAARSWKEAGGTIDLDHPDHRFCWLERSERPAIWLEEVAAVDRRAVSARRLSALPFRRPVGLDPRLARAAANLARVRPGDRVVDPFVGTGALLAEAALLGARIVGIDRDP
ncbi:MAG TPA: hypothetical protein VN842_00630, partial [Thermoplasmata archaeon]|nr:hypothetical protein [Thermoplasmata archaeon]